LAEDRWLAERKPWQGKALASQVCGFRRCGDVQGFRIKAEATRWLNGIVAAQETGNYIDPRLGKVTFSSFYQEWSTFQTWESSTVKAMNLAANSAIFGDVAFSDLKPSHVEAWVKWMQDKPWAPSTIKTRFNNVRAVLRAAWTTDSSLMTSPLTSLCPGARSPQRQW